MFKFLRIFGYSFLFLMSSNSNPVEFCKNSINRIKQLCNKILNNQPDKRVKFNLEGMTESIPYKLYLIIQELKKKQNSNLLLNRLILYGPPGNGKSTYARKIAQAIDASFHEISGPSIVNTYQGSGAENVNKIFEEAITENDVSQRNVVIFIDEVDSIATKNAKRLDNKAAVQSLWLNLDKVKHNPSIFVILATNEFKNLHPTLLDRFGDNMLEIKNPDEGMRKEVIDFYVDKFQLNHEVIKVDNLIKQTKGFSIRAIEDSLRSIKRISNLENDGNPSEQIINDILNSQKKKPLFESLESKMEKVQKYFSFGNCCIGGPLSIIVSLCTIYSYINPGFKKSNFKDLIADNAFAGQ